MIPQSKQEVLDILRDNLDKFASFDVERVGLFGSFVRDEANTQSDVDLLIVTNNSSWDNFCDLLDFTDTLFEGRKTDVITEKSLNELSGRTIFKEVEYVN